MKIKKDTKVWLCPTDTIYGLSARVSDIEAVERVRKIKGGRDGMEFIILIADIDQLFVLGIKPTKRQEDFLHKIWPGPVSVIFDTQCRQGSPSDTETLAVRLPDYPALQNLIRETGPIISTSANRHGETPVQTTGQAKEIFGSEVDEYLGVGPLNSEASTLVKIVR